jgi:hypothetical protein
VATEGAEAALRHAFATLNLDEVVSFTVPAEALEGSWRRLGWFISHPKILTIHAYRLDIPFSGTSCIGLSAIRLEIKISGRIFKLRHYLGFSGLGAARPTGVGFRVACK